MSARIARYAFLAIVLRCNVIDCISSSTSQQGTSTPSTIENQRSTTTLAESFDSGNNTTWPLWRIEALKDIAYYLRAHKFNEYDRRYETNPELGRREYYRGFPRPPLRSLHWEVHKNCEFSLLECLDFLRRRVRKAGLKRGDDTAVVIQEQQWDLKNNSEQIEVVDKDCKKMKELDDIQANPFEGPLERFQWRVTASYSLCWYTMRSDLFLEHLIDQCDNFANCLDPSFGPNNEDLRADDSKPYGCALYSFCPDPCCPVKHLTLPEKCWDMPENPCFEGNPPGQRECVLKRSENTDFSDIVLNRWNVTCSCSKEGFVWSSFFGMCIDIDECALGTDTCDSQTQICLNLPGDFKCACKWGHTLNEKTGKCIPSRALKHLVLLKEEDEEQVNKTLWSKFLALFEGKSSSERLSAETNLIILSCSFLHFVGKYFINKV